MAGYSEQREQNMDVKYLRKVLCEVDEQIPLPGGLRGASLRASLDNVYPTKAAPPNKKSGLTLNMRWFSWRSGFSYAAAFVLIVTLFYGLGFDRQPDTIVDGNGAFTGAGAQEDPVWEAGSGGGAQALEPGAAARTEPVEENSVQQSPLQQIVPDSADGSSPNEAETRIAQPDDSGVGGGSVTLAVESVGGYLYTWRANDATDPDKEGFPLTVDIVEEETELLVSQIDVPDMADIFSQFYAHGTISFAGAGDAGVVVRVYDVAEPARPGEMAVAVSPGTYVGARVYRNMLHVVSFTGDESRLTCDSEPLPDSDLVGACVITAIDLQTGEWVQQAYTGAGADIALHNLNAYINYYEHGEDGEQILHVAQIRLEEMDIGLGGVS